MQSEDCIELVPIQKRKGTPKSKTSSEEPISDPPKEQNKTEENSLREEKQTNSGDENCDKSDQENTFLLDKDDVFDQTNYIISHKIKSGDTLTGIALRYNVKVYFF